MAEKIPTKDKVPTDASIQTLLNWHLLLIGCRISGRMLKKLHKFLVSKVVSSTIFWGYNLIYIFFLFLVLLNLINISSSEPSFKWKDVFTFGGFYPTNVLVMIYTFILTPFATLILVILTKIYKKPLDLLKVFFGVEISLMGLNLLSIVFLRQMTPITWLFFLSITASIAGLLIHPLYPVINSKIKQTLLLLSQQAALLISGYISLLTVFFLPIIVAFIINILSRSGGSIISNLLFSLTHAGLLQFLFMLFFLILFVLSLSFFITAPIVAIIIFWNTAKTLFNQLSQQNKRNYAKVVSISFVLGFILIALFFSVQSSDNWYVNDLNALRNANTFEQKEKIAQKLIKNDKQIKNTLLSTYLARYKYLGDSNINILKTGYKNELGTTQPVADFIQKAFTTVALPFIYRGNFKEDVKQAAEDYEDLFDNSIQKGEQESIVKTLKATNTQDEIKAGLLDRDKQSVKIVSKVVSINSQFDGLLSKVTIEEEYKNTADRPQEVYYEFYLPEDSVVTELKLGPDLEFENNSADKNTDLPTQPTQPTQLMSTPAPEKQEEAASVAPKGAANSTYNQQVRFRVDPALLEQVGPRQYRLRIFPIPAQGRDLNGAITLVPQKNQRVRFSYLTIRSDQGVMLPMITQQRNVFIDSHTRKKYLINGQELKYSTDPKIVNLSNSNLCYSNVFHSTTEIGEVFFVPHAVNPQLKSVYSCQDRFSNANKNISGLKIAFLLDVSYSNKQVEWNKYLQQSFPLIALLQNNSIDLYYFNDTLSQKIPLTQDMLNKPREILHFGKTDRLHVLKTLPNTYDVVFMISDSGEFDGKGVDGLEVLPKAPVYLIHPQSLPIYNDALTTYILQAGGKVFSSGEEAIEHLWLVRQQKTLQTNLNVIDADKFGTWMVVKNGNILTLDNKPVSGISSDGFTQLAKKKIIEQSISKVNSTTTLASLDQIHQIAEQSSIVTPFSSMVVLVTEAQKEQLKKASQESSRYIADFDIGEETLGNPSGSGLLEIGAVPEPHEWVLIISGLILLAYLLLYEQTLHQNN